MSLIEMREVKAEIGGSRVLDGASLSLGPGELLGIVGRNGSGKTSALRAMLGLLPVSAGTVLLDGREIASLAPSVRASRVGYLPQARRVAWNMPVVEVVALATPFLDGAESRDRALTALAALELSHFAARGVAELSGGERARVLIGRALNTPGQALLLDEPLAGLDADAQMFVLDRLRAEAAEGRAVLMSLHDLTAARHFCDRVAVMQAGRVISDGPPAKSLASAELHEAFGLDADWIDGPAGPLLSVSRRQGA